MIIEADNDIYQELLQIIYDYLLNDKCTHLDLDKLKKIVVVANDKLPQGVGAHYENGIVLVKEGDVKNSLSCIRGRDMNKYIFQEIKNSSDEETKLLIDEIMHELFHCDAEKKMPLLHSIVHSEQEDIWKNCIARFWIECVVEYYSHKDSFLRKEELLKQISNAEWKINCIWESEKKEENMDELIYVASYFVALNLLYRTEEKYLENINDNQICDLYRKLFVICRGLIDREKYIDDYSEIVPIENIFKKYFDESNVKTF